MLLCLLSVVIISCNQQGNTGSSVSSGSSNQIPKPDPEFKGKIGNTVDESTADFPMPLKAPAGAPNVLIILLDDVGFGMAGTIDKVNFQIKQ